MSRKKASDLNSSLGLLGVVGEELEEESVHMDDTSESADLDLFEDELGESEAPASKSSSSLKRGMSGSNAGSERFRRTSKATAPASASAGSGFAAATSFWKPRKDATVDQSLNLMDSIRFDSSRNIFESGDSPGTKKNRQSGIERFLHGSDPDKRSSVRNSIAKMFLGADNDDEEGGEYGVYDLSDREKSRKRNIFCVLLLVGLVIAVLAVTLPSMSSPSGPPPLKTLAPTEAPTVRNEEDEAKGGDDSVEPDTEMPTTEFMVAEQDLDVSNVPQNSRLEALKFYIIDQDVAEPEELAKIGSPSKKAMHWIAQQDPASLGVPGFDEGVEANTVNEHALLQRYALATFYYAVQEGTDSDAGSGNALRSGNSRETQLEMSNREAFDSSWMSVEHICNWHGVTCDDDGESVLQIKLSKHMLQGNIPRELLVGSAMPYLTELDLSHNQLQGHLPPVTEERQHVGENLDYYPPPSELQVLMLNHNVLSGKMDRVLGFTKLKVLDLSHNLVTGAVPESISDLVTLEELSLSNNKLDGTVPEDSLAKLTGLTVLDLGRNEFAGDLPTNFEDLTNLRTLTLSGNKFTGKISSSFGDLTTLTRLDLNGNELEGTVPTTLGMLTALQRLLLDKNHLTGTMPQHVCYLKESTLQSLTTDCFHGDIECACCTDCS